MNPWRCDAQRPISWQSIFWSQHRKIEDSDVRVVLDRWGFSKNVSRPALVRKGSKVAWVISDTLGLTRTRQGKWHVSELSNTYPDVTRTLNLWILDQTFSNLDLPFVWTSLVIDKDLQAELHRDTVNEGLLLVKNSCCSQGGKLRYYFTDDGRMSFRALRQERSVDLNVHSRAVLLDGRRGHEVLPFKERLSMVAYTRQGGLALPEESKQKLMRLQFRLPGEASIGNLKAKLWQQPFLLLSKKRPREE